MLGLGKEKNEEKQSAPILPPPPLPPVSEKIETDRKPRGLPIQPAPEIDETKLIKKRFSPGGGPVFISLERYNEVKGELDLLRRATSNIKKLVSTLKSNRDTGMDMLENATGELENIDNQIEKISNTMRA